MEKQTPHRDSKEEPVCKETPTISSLTQSFQQLPSFLATPNQSTPSDWIRPRSLSFVPSPSVVAPQHAHSLSSPLEQLASPPPCKIADSPSPSIAAAAIQMQAPLPCVPSPNFLRLKEVKRSFCKSFGALNDKTHLVSLSPCMERVETTCEHNKENIFSPVVSEATGSKQECKVGAKASPAFSIPGSLGSFQIKELDVPEPEESDSPTWQDREARLSKKPRAGLRERSMSGRLSDTGANSMRRSSSSPMESLQEEPEDAKESWVQSSTLPVVSASACGIKRISVDTVARLLLGEFRAKIEHFLVIDCRYDYEYQGGHIPGAFNFDKPEKLEKFFNTNREINLRLAIIFHCEFSQNRGPRACSYFRQLDRSYNAYPRLTFPELYILDGGFKKFYETFPLYCQPQEYVSMWDPRYQAECKNATNVTRKSWSKTGIRSRTRKGKEDADNSSQLSVRLRHRSSSTIGSLSGIDVSKSNQF